MQYIYNVWSRKYSKVGSTQSTARLFLVIVVLFCGIWIGFQRPYTVYCGMGGGIYAKEGGVKFRKATTLFSLREVR